MKSARGLCTIIVVLLFLFPSIASSQSVLWDKSHGSIVGGYDFYDQYSSLIGQLNTAGYTVAATSQGVMVDDPADYDVLVISVFTTQDSAYSPDEVTRITQFVNNGGGLLIMSDNMASPYANVQPVAQAFDVQLALNNLSPDAVITSNLATHALFENGVTTLHFQAAGQVYALSPSVEELVWQEGFNIPIVTKSSLGQGSVITLGDASMMGNNFLGSEHNLQFTLNTFEYLANPVPEPATLLLLGLGSLAVLRRKKN